jgi:hypothetical protein
MNNDIQKQDSHILHEEDPQVEAALRNFRQSIHSWSEQEYSRTRIPAASSRRSSWSLFTNPIAAWGLAGVLAVSAVTVPTSMHYRHVEQQRVAEQAAAEAQRQQELQHQHEIEQAAMKISDDELLSHIDSDLAQAAPDAMEPLASLMNQTQQ